MIQAGKLRHRVTFQREVDVSDGMGGQTLEWSELGTVWASVNAVSSSESLIASRNSNAVTHSVLIRYFDGLRVTDRMLFDSRFFNVVSIEQPSRKASGTRVMVLEGAQV